MLASFIKDEKQIVMTDACSQWRVLIVKQLGISEAGLTSFLFCTSRFQDVLLCGVYARREAAYGNIDHARKIFDMALASIEGLPLVRSLYLPLFSQDSECFF